MPYKNDTALQVYRGRRESETHQTSPALSIPYWGNNRLSGYSCFGYRSAPCYIGQPVGRHSSPDSRHRISLGSTKKMKPYNQKTFQASSTREGRVVHRPFWILYLSLFIRASHQIGAAVFLCAFLPGLKFQLSAPWLVFAAASGTILLFTEWLRHRQIGRELSGLATFAKLLLLAAAIHGWLPPTPAVITAFVVSSVCAHAPKNFRHRLIY